MDAEKDYNLLSEIMHNANIGWWKADIQDADYIYYGPIAYKTTENFLRCFGLTDLSALPTSPDSTDQMDLDEYDEMNFGGSD